MKRIVDAWKLFHTKPYRNVKKICFHFLVYIILFIFFDSTHEWYTQTRFGYAVHTPDGFINFLPYIFLGAFFLLRFKNFVTAPSFPKKIGESILFIFLAIFFFSTKTQFSFLHTEATQIFMQSAFLLCGYVFLFLSVFGRAFMKYFFVDLSLLVLLLIPSHLAPLLIDHFWQYSSRVTIAGLSLLLPLLSVPYTIVPQDFLVTVKDFTVIIGPPCAGIHSLTAFTILFVAILLLIRQKRSINIFAATSAYLFGLVSVFLVNSIRVLLIILVGAYYSKELAVDLFHKTIGSVLLLLFFIAYISFILPKITKKSVPDKTTSKKIQK